MGLEKALDLVVKGLAKNTGNFVRQEPRTNLGFLLDKGLEMKLRASFRHESGKNRERFWLRGTFCVKRLENIWELFSSRI